MRKTLLFFAVILLGAHGLLGQSRMTKPGSGRFKDKNIYEMLNGLEPIYEVKFCFEPENLPWYKIEYNFDQITLHEALKGLLPKHGLTYVPVNDSLVAVCRLTDLNGPYLKGLRERCATGNIELPEVLRPLELARTVGDPANAGSGTAKTLTGTILDQDTGEGIAGANILINGKAVGAATNAIGQYKIEVPKGGSKLMVRYIGYRDTKIEMTVWEDGALDIPLAPMPLGLGEVLIEGNKAANKTRNTQTAVEALSVAVVKELPKLLGEADVVRSLNTLAGVSNVSDGATGFNVRGGNLDQNLALQDDAPIFNTAHVLGLFSVYNPDVVQNVTLYKGFVPARYGGRLSSVLDVKLRDGDNTKWRGNVGLSMAMGKARVEGPLFKKKVALLAAVRQSYSDWMLQFTPLEEGRTSTARFFDGLVKLSARVTERSSLNVSFYQSRDKFRYGQRFGYGWSNQIANATYRHPMGEKSVSVWQLNVGKYAANYFDPTSVTNFNLTNGLLYQNASWRAIYIHNNRNEVNYGVQWNRNISQPESRTAYAANSATLPLEVKKDRGEEFAAFAEDLFKLGTRWQINAGLRGVYYRNFGPKTQYIYQAGQPITPETVIDSVVYRAGQTAADYWGLEPRVSIAYQLSERQSLKWSYVRARQYIHQISNLAAPTPVDVWQVSNAYIAPQIGDQLDIGYATNWGNDQWELFSDVFYKRLQQVPVLKNLPTLLLNPHLETEILRGQGRSYGFECSFKKNKGDRWTGWLNYTWVRTFLKTPAGAVTVNEGDWFPSDFDQPHQVNAYAKYAFNPSITAGFNYTYRMGRPISAPNRNYAVGGVVVPDYPVRNNARVPDYHRLDFSLNVDQNKARISGAKFSFNFSIYNVLGRDNPFSVFFERKTGTYPKAYSLAVIGAAIPSIGIDATF